MALYRVLIEQDVEPAVDSHFDVAGRAVLISQSDPAMNRDHSLDGQRKADGAA